jgi:hypothetical protein
MAHGANSGYPGGSLGCTEFFTTHEHLPGVIIATGSLEQRISRSSLAERLNNDETVVFSLHGDGEWKWEWVLILWIMIITGME